MPSGERRGSRAAAGRPDREPPEAGRRRDAEETARTEQRDQIGAATARLAARMPSADAHEMPSGERERRKGSVACWARLAARAGTSKLPAFAVSLGQRS